MMATKREISEYRRRHAKQRAAQRYGIDISDEALNHIRSLIKRGESRMLMRQSNSRVIHRVEVDGVVYVVAYHSERHEILTFLPPGRSQR